MAAGVITAPAAERRDAFDCTVCDSGYPYFFPGDNRGIFPGTENHGDP